MFKVIELDQSELNRVIQLASDDCTTFEAILYQFGFKENKVINLIGKELKPLSIQLCINSISRVVRKKHLKKRNCDINKLKYSPQKATSGNKITKR